MVLPFLSLSLYIFRVYTLTSKPPNSHMKGFFQLGQFTLLSNINIWNHTHGNTLGSSTKFDSDYLGFETLYLSIPSKLFVRSQRAQQERKGESDFRKMPKLSLDQHIFLLLRTIHGSGWLACVAIVWKESTHYSHSQSIPWTWLDGSWTSYLQSKQRGQRERDTVFEFGLFQ